MDVGSVIGGGFRLLRERPLAVVVWGLLYMATVIAFMLVARPFAAPQVIAVGDRQAAVADLMSRASVIFLMDFVYLILFAILMTAAQRAVLRPAERSLFSLRLGMDELRMIGLSLLCVVGFYALLFVLGIVLVLLVAAGFASAGSGLSIAFVVVASFAMLALFAWLGTRFSLAFPLTLLRHKIIIGESWRLTRGRFWTLFTAYLVIAVILLFVWALVAAVTAGSALNGLTRTGFNPARMEAQMVRQYGSIGLMTIVSWLLSGILGGLSVALWGGAVAAAAREIVPDAGGIAETFA